MNKKNITRSVVAVAMLILSTKVSAIDTFDYHLKAKKVAENVYCFFGTLENISKKNGGNMVNSCYVKTNKGFVVIDSGPTFSYANQAYTQMQKIAPLPIKYVINTHDHDDHWLGNSFYKSKGALLIGPNTYEQNVASNMKTRMEQILGKKLYGKTKIVKLDKVVDHNLTFDLGGEVFAIKQPLPIAHTKGDLVVYLPNKKVLFVGDLVFNGRLTSLRDGSIIGSLKALDVIDGYKAKTIISGHGYQVDKNSTSEFRTYLSKIKKEVLKALDDGVEMQEITEKVQMPHFKKLKLYDVLHNRTVLDAYKELEMMEEDEE